MEPKITIIIPAYNMANYIKDSIGSVLRQTFTDWELIVVNDGSKDNTADIVSAYLSDSRIQLINQVNQGVSAARNTGIAAAKGKYIAFLDADDMFLPDNLEHKLKALESNPDIDFVYSDSQHCDKEMNELYVEKGVESSTLFQEVLLWQKETIPCLPSNVVIKTAALQGKLLFDTNLSNCADRYMKMLIAKNLKGHYIPETLVKYRHTPGSMSKQVALLDHDENYIIEQIREKDIVPNGISKNRVIANIYFILSGAWKKEGHDTRKAIRYGMKAIMAYPPILFKLLGKLF